MSPQDQVTEKGAYIRPEVAAFAEMMESVLTDHDGNKGDSWKDIDVDVLWAQLHEKYDDLCCFCCGAQDDQKNLIDLANYAMMLWHQLETTVRFVHV